MHWAFLLLLADDICFLGREHSAGTCFGKPISVLMMQGLGIHPDW
jgi:hypothetical protein